MASSWSGQNDDICPSIKMSISNPPSEMISPRCALHIAKTSTVSIMWEKKGDRSTTKVISVIHFYASLFDKGNGEK